MCPNRYITHFVIPHSSFSYCFFLFLTLSPLFSVIPPADHAFEFSARHGLENYQIDVTWMVINALQKVGLATNVKLPSEAQLDRLRIVKA